MLRKLSCILLIITFFSGNIKAQVNTCFEIESILVDACAPTIIVGYLPFFNIPIYGQPEGYNEMIRLKIGPNPLNTADLNVVRWGNKAMPWMGLYGPNDSTAITVAALNATVATPCGLLIEPTDGVLPANANVLMITSYAVSTVSNSFATLSDTLYVIFQNAKNTGGHFLNNNPNPAAGDLWQSPIIEFGSNCRDSVAYLMTSLIKSDGTVGLEDGARVDFTPDGTPTYINNGCMALVNSATAKWTTPGTVAPGSGIIFLDSLVTGTPGGTWSGEGIENNQIDPALWCGRTLSITYRVFNEVCNTIVEDTLTQTITFSSNISAAWSGPSQICNSASSIDLQPLVTGTSGGAWTGNGLTGSVFNPTGLNGEIEISYKVVDGTCEQTKTQTIVVIEEGDASWQNPQALCSDGGQIDLNQYITGIQGGVWSGQGVSGNILDPSALTGTVSLTYISGVVPCADTLTQSVEILSIPAPTLPESASYCTGEAPDQIIVPGISGATVKWYSDTQLENLIQTGDSLTPGATSGIYYAVQAIGSCNSPKDSTEIVFLELPEAPVGTTPQQYCPGAGYPLLSVTGTGQIVWYTNENLTDSISIGPNYQPSTGTNSFWVTASNERCSSLPFRIDLQELAFVEAQISIDGPLTWCGTNSALLRSDTSAGNLWTPGGATSQDFTINEPGTYTLKVTGVCNSDEAQITIIDGSIVAAFTADPESGEAPLPVNIIDQSEGATQTTWLLNGIPVTLSPGNVLLLESEGTFSLSQIVESNEGCMDTLSTEITVTDTKVSLVIPNSFTPNADGYNDVFKIKASGIATFKGTIFNRWGNQVFEWSDPQTGWDGHFNGSAAPAGVYFYVIKAKGKKGESLEKKGDVTLVR